MSDQQSPFTKLHVEEVTQAKRTLLDELNLPPKVTQFIRDNGSKLQIAFVVITVLICAWTFYNYYSTKQKNDSAALLAQAMQETTEMKTANLQKVISDYSGSGAAAWGKISLAHDQMDNKEFDKAQAALSEVLKSFGKDNPLYPLVVLDLAQSYELGGDLDAALSHYGTVRQIVGFAVIGYLGEARIYEQKNEAAMARETYEKVKTQENLDPALREWVEAKLAAL